jgi:dicarboxylate transporter 10
MLRIVREEGFIKLFRGVEWAAQRTALVTVGQIAFYDATKEQLLRTGYFDDTIATHFTASIFAGTVATMLSQPIDVCKTLAMNAKTGDYKGPIHLYTQTARQGYMVFTKGFVPAFVRLGPQTILTWIFLEQLRLKFGKRVPIKHNEIQSDSGQDNLLLLQKKVMALNK